MPKKVTSELAKEVQQERKKYFRYAFNSYLQNLEKKRLEAIRTFGIKATEVDPNITESDYKYYGVSGGFLRLKKKDYAAAFRHAREVLNQRGKTRTSMALGHFARYVPKFPTKGTSYNQLASAVKKLAKEPFKKPRIWKLEPNERKRYFALKKKFPQVQQQVRELLKAGRSKTQTRPPRDLIYRALRDLYLAHPSQVKVKLLVPLVEKDPQKTQQIIKQITQPRYILSQETKKMLKSLEETQQESQKIIQSSGLSEENKKELMDKLVNKPKTNLVPLTKHDPYSIEELRKKYGQVWYTWRNNPHLWGMDEEKKQKIEKRLAKKVKVGKYTLPSDILEEWQYQAHQAGREFHYEEPDQIYDIPFSGEANFFKREEKRFLAWQKVYHPDKPQLTFAKNWPEYLLERKKMVHLEKNLKSFFKKGHFPANVPKWINEVSWTVCEACQGEGCQWTEVEGSDATCNICFSWAAITEEARGIHPFLTSHNCPFKNTAKNVHEQARNLNVPWLGSLGLCGDKVPPSFSYSKYCMSHNFLSSGGGGCHFLWKLFERKTNRQRI